jgi:hypothetical protein
LEDCWACFEQVEIKVYIQTEAAVKELGSALDSGGDLNKSFRLGLRVLMTMDFSKLTIE